MQTANKKSGNKKSNKAKQSNKTKATAESSPSPSPLADPTPVAATVVPSMMETPAATAPVEHVPAAPRRTRTNPNVAYPVGDLGFRRSPEDPTVWQVMSTRPLKGNTGFPPEATVLKTFDSGKDARAYCDQVEREKRTRRVQA